MALSDEHQKIAFAIGKAKVGYEPKLAIAHEIGVMLFAGPYNGPGMSLQYLEFRRLVLSSHRAHKEEVR